MSFQKFLKEKLVLLLLVIFAVISTQILLLTSKMEVWIRIYIGIIPIICIGIALLVEYYHKKRFYYRLQQQLQELDNKYLLSEVMERPNFIEGELLKDILQETSKSMLENVNTYKHLQEDYKEYIELWIHEIKTPIAASKMIIQNHKSEITKSMEEELNKIENYTEQALFYARSNSVEKDYIITKANLKEIVNHAILKNKNSLLSSKISIEIHEVEETVYTDSKWTIFMVGQILQNSVQYKKEEKGTIEIYAKPKNEKIVLYIKDNGIGIPKGEITRVFDKGFTGSNGRMTGKKSTGIGLYLCKKLCDKLGLKIELDSEKDVGTEVRLVFPKNSYTNFT